MSGPYPRRVIVTTVPFGEVDPTPIELLRSAGIELVRNPLNRKLAHHEVREIIAGFPVVIAGTEIIDAETLLASPDLKAICRVGIGLDGVDLLAARRQGIAVTYTPDGPSPAVAELTVGLIIDLLRGVGGADRGMRKGGWTRVTGRRIAASTIGVIGVGRIGRRLIGHLLGGFPGVRILATDLSPDWTLQGVQWVDLPTILRESDVVSIHVPLTAETQGMIGEAEIAMMKSHATLINTARGGIVNEAALAVALRTGVIAGAAIDTFEEEPYSGELVSLESTLLTCHMGSMTVDCRARMEREATEEAIRFFCGEPFRSPVPEAEYENARRLHRN